MRNTRDPLNNEALTLQEAESLIRIAVKDAVFEHRSKDKLDKRVNDIILSSINKLSIYSLKQAAYISLIQFYQRERRTAEQLKLGSRLLLFLALSKLAEGKNTHSNEFTRYTKYITVREARDTINSSPFIPPDDKVEIINYGRALNMYHERYMKDYVRPVLERMAKDEALDPDAENYLGHRSTLRNRAEREVRYQAHLDEIDALKEKGVKLVICSSHANCSERCRPWQGRVYSLDGTSGTAPDGRKYVPLEEATNILTPNGKWYNGLLGFNCRHYLVPYKDHYSFPTVSAKTEEREYRIDQTQRHMERKVREWRIRAEMMKGVDKEAYVKAKAKVTEWNNKYISYSRAHGRAFFRSRTRIL